MIVKDEEEVLEQCLNSVKDLVDEIIIVDTGSKDKTTEIAKKFNAKIYYYINPEFDFSEARNLSLEKATGDWILCLDADETISQKDLEKIKQAIQTENEAFVLRVRTYINDSKATNWQSSKDDPYEENKKTTGWYPVDIIRLFKNKPQYRFKGKIHELIDDSIPKDKLSSLDVPIHHFGRLKTNINKKSELYTELGKEKIDQEKDYHSYYQLGIQLQEDGNNEKAAELFKKSIELNPNYFESWLNYGAVLLNLRKIDESVKATLKALKIQKNDTAYNNLGIALGLAGKYKEAVICFNKALKQNPNNAGSFFNLGLTFDKINKKDLASKCFQKAIELNPEYKKKVNIQ